MTVLVIAEHDNNELQLTTLNTITAGLELGDQVDLLVAGSGCEAVIATAGSISGISRVLVADHADYQHRLAESIAPLLVKLAPGYSHLLASATSWGKSILPRAAAKLGLQQISDISAIIDDATFERPIYAGSAVETVRSNDEIRFITVRSTSFEAAAQEGGSASVEAVEGERAGKGAEFLSAEVTQSERPELTSAKVVISGGRGLQSKENFGLIESLADKLGAAIGASRAAVDAGFISNDYQVGQTGKVVAPDLYIAIGISGAIQHLAGMKDSRVIVAINKDEEAPIFQVADYGWVIDLFQALPEIESALE